VKLASEIIRNLVFKHKKEALPTVPDPTSNRIRNKYSIFEDLTTKNHATLPSLADDPRVRSVWSFSGQIRFNTHESETIYKVKNPNETFDSIVVHPPLPSRRPTLAARSLPLPSHPPPSIAPPSNLWFLVPGSLHLAPSPLSWYLHLAPDPWAGHLVPDTGVKYWIYSGAG
jgi:hypothetical protein